MSDPIKTMADAVMRGVVASGVRLSTEADQTLAVRIMREELKAFLFDDRYASERQVALSPLGPGPKLALASVTVECVRRIAAEQVPA